MTTRRQGDHTPWQPPLRPPSRGLRVALGEPLPAVTNVDRDRQQLHHAALAYQRRAKELGQDVSYRDAVLAVSGGRSYGAAVRTELKTLGYGEAS
jgi:hypothetical protein